MVVYAPRVTVHPDRYGADRSRQVPMVKWLILHTSEQSGAEDPDDAEGLAAFMTQPGDRPSSSGGFYGASYHAVTDTDRIIPCTPDYLVAYAAGGANQYGLHLCLPVRIRARSTSDPDANVSRAEWLDVGSRPYIRQAAEWIVDKARLYRIPLRRITDAEMAAGSWGFCDHWTASRAFRKSDHTDVGPDFPWDVLAADIASIVNPPPPIQEDDMKLMTPRRVTDTRNTTIRDAYKAKAGSTSTITIPEAKGYALAQVTVTVAEPEARGHLTTWPAGDKPDTSFSNYEAGQTIPETLFVELDDNGAFRLFTHARTHLIVDFTGVAATA
jgi:hypothetical protein